MPKTVLLRTLWTLMFVVITGCSSLSLVEPYDVVIDKGLMEFSEDFHAFTKTMVDLRGTHAGTYEANIATYNQLDAKIDVLISRTALSASGKGCSIPKKLKDHIKSLLRSSDTAAPTVQIPVMEKGGNSYGCTNIMLRNIKLQMPLIREIHQTGDTCTEKTKPGIDAKAAVSKQQLSCLRENAIKSIVAIMDQTINAAWFVETSKKKLEESDSWL